MTLKSWKKKQEMTDQQLAKFFDTDQGTISRWINHKVSPSKKNINLIFDRTNKEVDANSFFLEKNSD